MCRPTGLPRPVCVCPRGTSPDGLRRESSARAGPSTVGATYMGKLSFSPNTPYSSGHASCRGPQCCPMGCWRRKPLRPARRVCRSLGDRDLSLGPRQPLVDPGTGARCQTLGKITCDTSLRSDQPNLEPLVRVVRRLQPSTQLKKTARMSSRILNWLLYAIRIAPALSSAKQSRGAGRPRRSGIALHLLRAVLGQRECGVWAVIPRVPAVQTLLSKAVSAGWRRVHRQAVCASRKLSDVAEVGWTRSAEARSNPRPGTIAPARPPQLAVPGRDAKQIHEWVRRLMRRPIGGPLRTRKGLGQRPRRETGGAASGTACSTTHASRCGAGSPAARAARCRRPSTTRRSRARSVSRLAGCDTQRSGVVGQVERGAICRPGVTGDRTAGSATLHLPYRLQTTDYRLSQQSAAEAVGTANGRSARRPRRP